LFEEKDFIPRTYSVKGFKQRKRLSLKKLAVYLSLFMVFLFVLGIAALSAADLI